MAREQERAREHVRVALADRLMALALADQPGEAGREVVLAAAAAVEQVGQQHIGVEVDDPAQQLVGPQATHDSDDAFGDAVQRVRARVRGSPPPSLTTRPHSRVIRSATSAWVSGHRR